LGERRKQASCQLGEQVRNELAGRLFYCSNIHFKTFHSVCDCRWRCPISNVMHQIPCHRFKHTQISFRFFFSFSVKNRAGKVQIYLRFISSFFYSVAAGFKRLERKDIILYSMKSHYPEIRLSTPAATNTTFSFYPRSKEGKEVRAYFRLRSCDGPPFALARAVAIRRRTPHIPLG